jgi:hypothetical protein
MPRFTNVSIKHRTIDGLVTAFLFVAICVAFAERVSRPPLAVRESAPLTAFSAERAMKHVLTIAQLSTLGLEPQVQRATGVGTHYPEAGRVQKSLQRPETNASPILVRRPMAPVGRCPARAPTQRRGRESPRE